MTLFWMLILTGAFVCRGVRGETNGTLTFLMVGDWGGAEWEPYYTHAEQSIAEQMGIVGEKIGSSFTISVGDNFYLLGVRDVDDHRFQDTYENVFTAESLQSTWYSVCGNHDHYGNASAQVAYTDKSSRWHMPNYYYNEVVTIPDTDVDVEFVFIDTVILAGNTHPTKTWLPPPGPESVNAAEDQWEWIEETLAASTAKWLFVVGHYPVWSISLHGPTEVLVERLRPMLIKYNVSAYFCGHEHDMQHIREWNGTVEYFISGAGHGIRCSADNIDNIPPASLKYHFGNIDLDSRIGAFNWVSISPTSMNVSFVDQTGYPIYFYSMEPTRNV
ncbi:tartrate-resistant acid phosphatase type 5-like [Dysidea avara]|uniref:tartrate-resistant acid phosphatase type 5-like n=1 Tax=Dysidea avara TaxID=196820 RepID=UPI00332E26DC